MDVSALFLSEKVQSIVTRTARNLAFEYANKGVEESDLYNQAYLALDEIMQGFKELEDTVHPEARMITYINLVLPMRVKSYIWEFYGIKRTPDGHYRAKAEQVEYDPNQHATPEPDLFDEYENREVVTHALSEITELQREILNLEFYDDMTPEEIIEYLGIKPGTYRKRRFDAISAVERILDKIA